MKSGNQVLVKVIVLLNFVSTFASCPRARSDCSLLFLSYPCFLIPISYIFMRHHSLAIGVRTRITTVCIARAASYMMGLIGLGGGGF